jgi:hypothetical protein
MMGYSETNKGYRLYDLDSRKIILSRDVVFDETQFPGLTGRSKGKNHERSMMII